MREANELPFDFRPLQAPEPKTGEALVSFDARKGAFHRGRPAPIEALRVGVCPVGFPRAPRLVNAFGTLAPRPMLCGRAQVGPGLQRTEHAQTVLLLALEDRFRIIKAFVHQGAVRLPSLGGNAGHRRQQLRAVIRCGANVAPHDEAARAGVDGDLRIVALHPLPTITRFHFPALGVAHARLVG